jgi:hypothetical protein
MNANFQMVQPNELQAPNLSIQHRAALLMAVNAVGCGLGSVTVAVCYPAKQTNTEPRIAGKHYVEIPGVGPEVHVGKLTVGRRVDNKANRRSDTVGKLKMLINSLMRADGVYPSRPTGLCVEGLTSFVVTGFQPTIPLQQDDAAQAPVS